MFYFFIDIRVSSAYTANSKDIYYLFCGHRDKIREEELF